MKDDDDDLLPISTPTASAVLQSPPSIVSKKENSLDSSSVLWGRGRYKFWALGAILFLAFCSMLTGTVTLRRSVGNLNRRSDDVNSPATHDFDVLDMEERENLVKHLWGVHTNSRRIRLPSFWQDAFMAAYEDLTSEVPEVQEAAISEIARMSVRYIELEPPPLHRLSRPRSSPKQTENG
ncbi:Protein of unknown function (DUF1195) [Abeliophyllum distichum]|uniref:Sugar transporter n=1 Tax=Abeliophyllum distichum TaxID=126358 RepID=A0ABD1V2J5_9LAMI